MREMADFEKEAMQNPVFRDAYDNHKMLSALGNQLRAIRRESGLSQQQLEQLSGVDQAEISRIERAQSATERGPSLSLLTRLAHAAGYNLELKLVRQEPGPKQGSDSEKVAEYSVITTAAAHQQQLATRG